MKKMRNMLIVTGMLLLLFSCGVSKPEALFWKAEGERCTVYLLGSIHVGKQEFYPLPDYIEETFSTSEQLAVEANLQSDNMSNYTAMIQEMGMYPLDDSLENHIPKELYDRIGAYVGSFGLEMTSLKMMKPWIIAMMVQMLELKNQGLDETLGIDKHFLDLAQETNKPIIELEGVENQIAFFNGFSDSLQVAYLTDLLDNQFTIFAQMDSLITAWQNADVEAIEKTMLSESKKEELKPLYEVLIYKRNADMAEKIDVFLKEGKSTFVVVGAAHLIGERSIVDILKKKGYSVALY
ncbi:MAG: TraB/GumN family protein [Candidatus Cloacimonetes bacterium]|nr:TraB/GumN family protein [Candidatus Cloacimonadota bacterium]